jgi:signal transduction histidine kinase/DNA-binding response OmpR family regulator
MNLARSKVDASPNALRASRRNASRWQLLLIVAVTGAYLFVLTWTAVSGWGATLASLPLRPEAIFLYATFGLLAALPFGLRFLYSHALVRDLRRATLIMGKARDVARENAEKKSAFLATMSHEIRTPLNAVIGFASLLDDKTMSPQQKEYVTAIKDSSNHLLTIINDILDFSKIEAGRIELDESDVDVEKLVHGCIKTVELRAASGVKLRAEIAPETPRHVIGDATRLRQILLNLLVNALKFTPKGEVKLRVRPEQAALERTFLRFEVHDTGIGISAADQKRLFVGFTQIDHGPRPPTEGTGLGLAISHRLTTLMGGSLTVRSSPGRGSTFVASIPAPPLSDLPIRTAPAAWNGLRLLVIEPDPFDRAEIVRYARAWGLKTRATADSVTALAWLTAGDPFDLVAVCVIPRRHSAQAILRYVRQSPRNAPTLIMLTRRRRTPRPPIFAAQVRLPPKSDELYRGLEQALASRPHAQPDDVALPTKQHLKILIAEDNPLNTKLALRVLEQMGQSADVAINGAEAVKAVTKSRYDVVFMDIQMPVMNGLEATRRIYTRVSASNRPMIVGLSANAMPEDRERCLRAGMDDYLAKPMDQGVIREMLLRAGQKRQATAGLAPS